MSHPKEHHSATPFEKLDVTLNRAIGLGVYRFLLLGFVVAQFWLTANYVKKEDFERLKSDVLDIKLNVKLIAERDGQLKDHESRLRALEQKVK